MTFIFPFEEEFAGSIHTIYYVNEDNQQSRGSSTTTSSKCPNCEEKHIYKVFDEPYKFYEEGEWVIEVHRSKCPSCRKHFDLKIEFELD